MSYFTAIVLLLALAWGGFEAWRWWQGQRQGGSFAESVQLETLRRQIQTLQKEQQAQRQQIETLRTQIVSLSALIKTQATSSDKTTAKSAPAETRRSNDQVSPSPEYAEALAWARRGATAQELVQRCGITLAEAQLLCSLIQAQRAAA